jgi:CubicO group peptidase (beta-lactamase class C family)
MSGPRQSASTNPSDDPFQAVDQVVTRAVASGIPAIAAAIGDRNGTRWQRIVGHVDSRPGAALVTSAHRFDLASLTKVVVTLPVILRLVESGDLHLGSKVADLLPAFTGDGKHDVTVAHLLTHTSGLPAHVPFWQSGDNPASVRDRIVATPLEVASGSAVIYSDLGFMILGFLAEAISGRCLDDLAASTVMAPLGLDGATYRPNDAGFECVATEVVEERGGLVLGDVHDENAMALGGVAGHAGLFATLDDIAKVARFWAGGGTSTGRRFLSDAAIAAATQDRTSHLDPRSSRGYGWVRSPNAFAIPNDLASPRAFSHTGFTGTSIMVDPHWGIWAVILTNRVNPTRHADSPARIRATRAAFHGATWASLT